MAKRVKVKKTITGKLQIVYQCPSCATELKSPETDVGNLDHCPTCRTDFIVPGAEQIEAYNRDLKLDEDIAAAAKRNEIEREMQKKLDAQQEERERIESEYQQRIAEQKLRREASIAEIEAEKRRVEKMPTKICQYCFSEVKFEAFRCPHCTEYLTPEGKRAFRDSVASGTAAGTAFVARTIFGGLSLFCLGAIFFVPLPLMWIGGLITCGIITTTLQLSVSDWRESNPDR